ncbi:hypothetical protein A5643_04940 [Mycobacterium sp. 1274756.6]|nr:hypothetical protein A5643_04940 [Mycobacterium sp. 1274756.6]
MGDRQLVGYVVLDEQMMLVRDREREARLVGQWQDVYEGLYGQGEFGSDSAGSSAVLGEDFGGWNSSFTGEPIALEQMVQWRSAAVARVSGLRPQRVLEIGVGSGLLLAPLAPQCSEYWGTDFSAATIRALQVGVAGQSWADRVRLRVQPADVVEGLPAGYFDVVVLNSVIQYFPSAGYLLDVLAEAVRLLAPGGSVFVGDVRNLSLLAAFTAAVVCADSDGQDSAVGVRERVHREMLAEQELLLAPEFFAALPAQIPDIAAVDLRLKDMGAINELSGYRYEVVLHKAPVQTHSAAELPTEPWQRFATLSEVGQYLRDRQPAGLRVTGVPYAGTWPDVALMQGLAGAEGRVSLAEVQAGIDAVEMVSVRQCRLLGEQAGYATAVTWSPTAGLIDVIFTASEESEADGAALVWTDLYCPAAEPGSLAGYVNDPAAVERVAELRTFVSEKLPDYMVPAAIMILDKLPLTVNGKLDRRALPSPEFSSAAAYRQPRDRTEEKLVALFSEVLGVNRVGIDDSFFDLGGHSLSAIRLLARIRVELGAEVPIRVMFDAPTVAQLAEWITTHGGQRAGVALTAQPRPQVIPLSYAQQRLWFLEQLQGPSAIYNMPVALRLCGNLDTEAFGHALADVVGRHESLRTIFTATGGVAQQVVLPAEQADFGWQIIDAAGWTAEQLADAVGATVGHHFDLATQIPLHAKLFRIGAQEYVLVAVMHHIAGDGSSIAPLLRDLGVAYAARCADQPPGWAPLAVQYADYTLWQQQWLGEETDPDSRLSAQLAYWQQALAGLPEQLKLPTDRPYPPTADHHGAAVSIHWPAQLQQQINAVARAHDATSFMVVQAGLAVLLAKMSACTDIPIGFPIAGRQDPALDELIGFFVNTLVLRIDVSGDPTIAELLTQIRQTSLTAYENQDVPFEVLVDHLNPTRSLSHHPLIQVMLAWQNFTGQTSLDTTAAATLGDITVTPLTTDTHTARMDLMLSLEERWTPTGTPDGIHGLIEYRTDIFDAQTIETFVRRLQRVLTVITATEGGQQ